ncbi:MULTISPECIES: hypothetical protein [unclassified Campylobacter]|uniref:hypothetical protein n=1 Tax=unclassified Campylobacter TaxID=2593542 RepID=UPI0022E9CFE3|nr:MULTISPECIES: hypothetical protein [unclassified Campylobacter]MDA3055958.1 hypothetical protein [Campylobacter sp. CN_NA1]MDA3065103.1 hypothetical protein [Campylobacter sp. CN_NE4]MDA3067928.1 hypothetical protein [Campylobacter sp. CN_NE3]MDA3082557.1 hypothetical protein [Campylobacter sp. CN_EL2]MDA3083705.1 hypothetical protein [Campylobacter sp. CN_NE1]
MITLVLIIFIWLKFDNTTPINHTEKLSNHYEKYKNQIIELVDFVAKNNTKNIKFQIEFEDEYSKFWFRIYDQTGWEQNRNKDEFLQILDWDDETLNLLKDKLKEANCISYEHKFYGDNFATIGIYRTFLDMYFFKIYDNDVSKNEILKQTDDCLLQYYKDNVVFEFRQSNITSGCGFP